MTFSNTQLMPEQLPQVSDLKMTGLHRNYLTVELMGWSILWIIFGLVVMINIFFLSDEWPVWLPFLLIGLWLAIVLVSATLTILGFKKKKYALRQKDIVYQKGLIWRKFSVLPFNRVQHAEVHQGPIERLFQLGQLKIFTAGGASSDLSISGLELEKAQAIKQFILQKTVLDEEE